MVKSIPSEPQQKLRWDENERCPPHRILYTRMGMKKATGSYRMGWSPPNSQELKEDPSYFQDKGKIVVKMASMETGPRGRSKFLPSLTPMPMTHHLAD